MRRTTTARWGFGAAWLLCCACGSTGPAGGGSEPSKTTENSSTEVVKPAPPMTPHGSDASPDNTAHAGSNAAPSPSPSPPSGGSTAPAGTAGSTSPPMEPMQPMEPPKMPPPAPRPSPEPCPNARRTEVKDSLASWQALSAKAGGRYSYTRSFRSFSSYYCQTTIHFEGGKATSRSQLTGTDSAREGVTDMLWIETASELDTHPSACHPVVTLDALYEQCLNDVLCKDPKQNRIYVEFDDAGLLRQCVFVPINCADDCSDGVSIEAVRIGDDAPECCPPDPAPSCCMAYGGAEVGGKCSGQKCDGMPRPEASWHRELDDYGCPKWVEPPPDGECCGCF